MSLLENALRSAITPSNTLQGLLNFGYGGLTESSRKVNQKTSLTISAFYCGINTLANSIAILPFSVIQKTDNTTDYLVDHPVTRVLKGRTNNYSSPFVFKHVMAVAVLMRGNAYAKIERDEVTGNITSLTYMEPDLTTVVDINGQNNYYYKGESLLASEVLHVPGFSFDGKKGKSVLEFAADNLGTTLNAQKYSSTILENQGLSYGVIETEKVMTPDIKDAVGKAFSKRLSAMDPHRAAVLDEGMQYKRITLTPEESKFIETYANGISDIARWLSMPRHKLHIEGEGGYNALTQMELDYLQSAVMPLAEKFKQEFDHKLFTQDEKAQSINVHQNFKKLLQVDPTSRAQYYKDMTFVKAITPNEIRKLEDLNPYEDGDDFLQMANLLNEQQIQKQIEDEN